MSNVNAGPTKAFFVTMLTRDIDLADAILDLLDNCVDGLVRQLKLRTTDRNAPDNEKPYVGYWAKIIATPDRFEIWDNCGGIDQELAEKYAFMLGRPDTGRDSDIENSWHVRNWHEEGDVQNGAALRRDFAARDRPIQSRNHARMDGARQQLDS